APSTTRSATSVPVATSRTVVPVGRRTIRSFAALPLRFRPSPGAPASARKACLYAKSPSDASCASARSTTSPPRPPSPPSGPPRGTCASRRKEITPRPPLPPRTVIRARSRNMRHLRQRSHECADAHVRHLLAQSDERARDAVRLAGRHELEHAQRIGVQVAQQEGSAFARFGQDGDQRVLLLGSIEETRQ